MQNRNASVDVFLFIFYIISFYLVNNALKLRKKNSENATDTGGFD